METIEDLTLEGIAWDADGNSMAIINGVILKEDEQVGKVRIVKISGESVKLLLNNTAHMLYIVSED